MIVSIPFAVNLVDRGPASSQLVSAFRAGRHESSDIVSLAEQIKHADVAVRNTACNKLGLILDQIRFLQSQAEKILQETDVNEKLHHAACNFQKRPGTVYHLYEKEGDGAQTYFSMLSLDEWGPGFKHKYLGSYRLEGDFSWTAVENVAKRTEDQAWAERLLDAHRQGNGATGSSGSLLAIQEPSGGGLGPP